MLVGACLAPKHLEACLRNEAVWQSNGTASQMLSAVSHPGTSPWSSRGSAVSAAVHHVGDEVHDRSVAAALVRGAKYVHLLLPLLEGRGQSPGAGPACVLTGAFVWQPRGRCRRPCDGNCHSERDTDVHASGG